MRRNFGALLAFRNVDQLSESRSMKWFVCNAFGAICWIAGVSFAKGTSVPDSALAAIGDHRMLAAAMFWLAGAAMLAWSNFRSAT
jgi:hypothetical protein